MNQPDPAGSAAANLEKARVRANLVMLHAQYQYAPDTPTRTETEVYLASDVLALLAALATAEAEKDEMRETLRIAKEDIEASRQRAGLSLRRIERAIDPAALTAYVEKVQANYHKATGPQAENEGAT